MTRLSYEDMARGYLKDLVGQAFGLESVEVDGDGDLPFACGTAMFYISVAPQSRLMRVWSLAVRGIDAKKVVLREVNEANAMLALARVYVDAAGVWVEGCLPMESVRPEDIRWICGEVGSTADRVGSLLAAVHGGCVALPGEARYERED